MPFKILTKARTIVHKTLVRNWNANTVVGWVEGEEGGPIMYNVCGIPSVYILTQ